MALQLVITDAGRARVVDQASGGFRAVRIARAGLSPEALAPTPATAALPGEVKRVDGVAGEATAADVIHVVVTDASDDAYTVRSLALYLDDGTLFALYGQADPIVEKAPAALLMLAIDVALVDLPAATITFGDAHFLNPLATSERPGVVRLATAAEAVALADRRLALTPATLEAVFGTNRVFTDRGSVSVAAIDQADRDGAYTVERDGFADTLLSISRASSTGTVQLLFEYRGGLTWRNRVDERRWSAFRTIWHSGNDGAGSGLDADTIDGIESAQILCDRGTVALAQLDAATANGCYSVDRGVDSDTLLTVDRPSSTGTVQLRFGYQGGLTWRNRVDGKRWTDFRTIWHSGNDGAGSGLDADTVDGIEGTQILCDRGTVALAQVDTATANGCYSVDHGDISDTLLTVDRPSSTGTVQLRFGFQGALTWRNRVDGRHWSAARTIWHNGNDGADSGLDADLIDGIESAQLMVDRGELPAAQLDAATGNGFYGIVHPDYSDSLLSFNRLTSTGAVQLLFGWQGALQWRNSIDNRRWTAFRTIWHSGNDGAGSGLDADLIDGIESAQLMLDRGEIPAAQLDSVTGNGFYAVAQSDHTDMLLSFNRFTSTGTVQLLFGWQGELQWRNRVDDKRWTGFRTIWHSENDGSGSGLDADLLDGRDAAAFAAAAHTHAAADLAGAFAGSLADNGYTVLPNGLILQWLTGAQQAAGTSGAQSLTLPIAFPNRCLHASVSATLSGDSVPGHSLYAVTGVSTTKVTIERQALDHDMRPSTPAVFAIGY